MSEQERLPAEEMSRRTKYVKGYVRTFFAALAGMFSAWAFDGTGMDMLEVMLLCRLVLEIDGP